MAGEDGWSSDGVADGIRVAQAAAGIRMVFEEDGATVIAGDEGRARGFWMSGSTVLMVVAEDDDAPIEVLDFFNAGSSMSGASDASRLEGRPECAAPANLYPWVRHQPL